jgi:RND family efflux transporter MFP subunit
VTADETFEQVVGTIRSKLKASIEAKVSGKISKMEAYEGRRVKAGDLLATIDAKEIQAKLDQATAVHDQAERDLKRLSDLYQRNAVPKQQYENADAQAKVARANLEEAQTLLGYTKMQAPFDGIVTKKYAELGDLAAPGKALLEVEDLTALRLEAAVPESMLSHVRIGQELTVLVPALSRELNGTVSEIVPTVDARSRTFNVKIDLPPLAELRSGIFAQVRIPLSQSRSIFIPEQALLKRGQLEIVFVNKNNAAELRLVRSGKRAGGRVEILAGLEPGLSVVSENADKLTEGQALEVLK